VRGLAALILVSTLAAPAAGAERWEALQALPRVAVEVTLSPEHPDVAPAEVQRRVEEALRRTQPAPLIDPASEDRLHLTAGVRSYSSSELRGFPLPFSGTYGIGPVRLALRRPAAVAGLPNPLLATVWQAERQAKGPWRNSASEILELADEVVAAFLAAYPRAAGQCRRASAARSPPISSPRCPSPTSRRAWTARCHW